VNRPVTPTTTPAANAPGGSSGTGDNAPTTRASYPSYTALDQQVAISPKLARLGKLADAIGREAEIEQIITFSRGPKNPIRSCWADAGVGKTAIVEGLAWRSNGGWFPRLCRGKRIIELEMGSLTAGTQYRGQFEERMKKVVQEADRLPPKSFSLSMRFIP